jgi:hypothetical protein
MATRITCPRCGRQLLLPEDCTAELLSCPRCLGQLNNPQASSSTAIQTEAPPPPSPVTGSLGSQSAPRPRVADLDVEVRRDNRGMRGLLLVLALFGSFGVGYALLGSFALLMSGEYQALLGILGILAVLTVISAVWVAMNRPGETPGAFIGRTMIALLTIVGVGVALLLAALILLFTVCIAKGGKC